MNRWGWRPYVPVARRRAQAQRTAAKFAKSGKPLEPVEIEGLKIARTFWGEAWCDNLEGYSDFANRLPRGRTYVRNGSVIDLKVTAGRVEALVSGSDLYKVKIQLSPLERKQWQSICRDCAGSIDSLLDLLAGKFDKGVMQRLTRQQGGLFPKPQEIQLQCSCPDWATMCKHVAAVLYGVGARLDDQPELLFVLRQVDHLQLLSQASKQVLHETMDRGAIGGLEGEDLSALFGIDLDSSDSMPAESAPARSRRTANAKVRPVKRAAKRKGEATSLTKKAKKKGKVAGPDKKSRAVTATAKAKSAKKKAAVKKGATKKAKKRDAQKTGGVRAQASARRSPKAKVARKSSTKSAAAGSTRSTLANPKKVRKKRSS